jgi:hypothetical protein
MQDGFKASSSRSLKSAVAMALLAGVAVAGSQVCSAAPPPDEHSAFASLQWNKTLDGKLGVTPGIGPVLQTPGKNYTLLARAPWLMGILEDERLLGRELRLQGIFEPDGDFRVVHLFTVKNGKLFKVDYYCETCNISALGPGPCVCCQQNTELRETPVGKDNEN